jgi:arylsulfatase A-like enzyme
VTGYRKILGTTRVAARIALDLYDREKPELLMVYFQGTDEAGHVLGRYFPPRLPSISEADFRKYSGAIEAIYVEHDRILGELAKRAARDGAALVLVSDHGFRWDETRPVAASGTGFDTAFLWHESAGVMIAAGPGFVPSKARGKASVFDVAPTARLFGLPPDPRFEGSPSTGSTPGAARFREGRGLGHAREVRAARGARRRKNEKPPGFTKSSSPSGI